MAAGIPAVVTDMPVYRQLFEAEHCALFVSPFDPAAIAGAIEYLLTHEREAEAMGQRGRAAVEARYQWAHAERRLVECYAALAPSRSVVNQAVPSGA